jgi:dihydrodipicolinate synthase/N-acetylneuraminate lyase
MAARYPSTVMVSVVCPWDEHEQLDEGAFRHEIDHAIKAGFRHVYVFGTAGEGYGVDTARFRRVIEVFGDEMGRTPDARAMVGVIGLSTGNVVERLAIAHEMGFREFQISFPIWQTVTDAEALTFFQDVCGSFPDSLFMHYNTGRVGRILNGRHYRPIVDAIPNLVATKTMTSDGLIVASVVRDAPELVHFLSETSIADGSLYGTVGLLATFGALAPKKCWALLEAGHEGRLQEAAEIGGWFDRLGREVFDPLMADRRIDGAYDKLIEKLSPGQEAFPLRMLSPYRSLTEAEYRQAVQTLRERFPDCE